ncbi:MAG: hypothetical protein JOY59_12780 [Candidatus Eremiobacteraeota bacterium]|nr:hypothetical protein [Candidatus Eremiobacteraeota bacterium]
MKTVHVLTADMSGEFVQSLYQDTVSYMLIPNLTFVDENGDVLFETNSLGMRGPEVEPGKPFAVVWGDSTVFCYAIAGGGWPEQINDGSLNCLFLNGGFEGSDYQKTLRRALVFNRATPAALNILMPGWAPFSTNRHVREDLQNALDEMPNAVLLTAPTFLNGAIINTDLSSFFCDGNWETRFQFGDVPYSIATQHRLFAHIVERNEIIRSVAAETRTPLIDLFAFLYTTEKPQDLRRHFGDISHLRPSAYPVVSSFIRESVRTLLARRTTGAVA